jgi:hypothetical protein
MYRLLLSCSLYASVKGGHCWNWNESSIKCKTNSANKIRLNDLDVLLIEYKDAVKKDINYLVSDFWNLKVRRKHFKLGLNWQLSWKNNSNFPKIQFFKQSALSGWCIQLFICFVIKDCRCHVLIIKLILPIVKVKIKVKIKLKFTLEQVTKVHRGTRGIALLFH